MASKDRGDYNSTTVQVLDGVGVVFELVINEEGVLVGWVEHGDLGLSLALHGSVADVPEGELIAVQGDEDR